MTVLLRRRGDLPEAESFNTWCAIGRDVPALPAVRRLPDEGARIERAFDAVADTWLAIARELGGEPTANLAHAPAAVANVSDFGLMLAWETVVAELAAAAEPTLVICDDPWLFRHLSEMPGVASGPPPPIWPARLSLALRGWMARFKCAATVYAASLTLRHDRKRPTNGAAVVLVYGHPRSSGDGEDAYFGSLMKEIPELTRVLHVDCPAPRARQLGGPRTTSLHAWGTLTGAFALPFARWQPSRTRFSGPYGRLIHRAAVREGATAQGAMISWQCHCQRKWLSGASPSVVAWPWENHSWERDLVRAARRARTRTVGYQHSVVGRQMLNYAAGSNADGEASLPDRILCSGRATLAQLRAWKIPDSRLDVGGSLRIPSVTTQRHDPGGPVFLALPFDMETAAQMVAAAGNLTATGYRFLVKDHPMTPFHFSETDALRRTDRPLGDHAGISVVIYAATTIGLEAVLAGLPTIRFRPRGRIALNILPSGLDLPATDEDGLLEALRRAAPPPPTVRENIFSPVSVEIWRRELTYDRPDVQPA